MDLIAEEIAYYKANREAFTLLHNGKHLVIKGKAIIGVYNSKTLAIETTIKEHAVGTFIIERPTALK